MKKKIILLVMIILIFIIFLPLILNEFIFENNYITKVSNDGWASFFGSYIGGVIGGTGTLVAMVITLWQTQQQIKQADEKEKCKELIKEVSEVAKLVSSYISDMEVYCDKIKIEKNKIEKIEEEKKYYLVYGKNVEIVQNFITIDSIWRSWKKKILHMILLNGILRIMKVMF